MDIHGLIMENNYSVIDMIDLWMSKIVSWVATTVILIPMIAQPYKLSCNYRYQ